MSDPAFLFYPGDWLGGTQLFSRAHKGAYMDILMAQFTNGHMSLDEIKHVLGPDYDTMWESRLKIKFKIDANGLYYNEKLEKVMEERRRYTAGRLNNLHKKDNAHMDTTHGNPLWPVSPSPSPSPNSITIELTAFGKRLIAAFTSCKHFPPPKDKDVIKIQDAWEKLYSDRDIEREIIKADSWIASNGKRTKLSFISNWLEKAPVKQGDNIRYLGH